MDWCRGRVSSVFFVCWGAQAGLYHFYNIPKYNVKKKIFGVFKHYHCGECDFLLRGMDDEFFVPHSRHTEAKKKDIVANSDLEILIESKKAGVHLIANKDRSFVFATGHAEYDRETLAQEYFRDKKKGLSIDMPYNYFPRNDDAQTPKLTWRANAGVIYRNWINFIYQTTHYNIKKYRMAGK